MLYRIRYRHESAAHEGELSVEANSPTEALVKFRHSAVVSGHLADQAGLITSVSVEDPGSEVLT